MGIRREFDDFLSLDKKIDEKIRQIDELKAMATNITPAPKDGVDVMRTREMDKIGTIVGKIVDLEKEVDEMVDAYADKKAVLRTYMTVLTPLENEVVELKYMKRKTYPQVAEHFNKTKRWAIMSVAKSMTKMETSKG